MSLRPVSDLASILGVSVENLNRLGVCPDSGGWRWPERNSEGAIVGYARRLPDGDKRFVPGGTRGLTLGWPLPAYAGTGVDDPILIVEGMSDTAAGMDLGFVVIGRYTARAKATYLIPLVKGKHVVIIAENDGGAGRDGANGLAAELKPHCLSVKVVFPPPEAKDLREWFTAPMPVTREELLSIIARTPERTRPRNPEIESATCATKWLPIPLDVFPEPIQSFIKASATSMCCDPAYVALPLLASLAGAIGLTRTLEIKAGMTFPCIIWAGIIGEPGTIKSPALRTALQFTLNRQHAALAAHRDALEVFKPKKAEYERDLTHWMRSKMADPPPEEPAEPAPERVLVKDLTIEALAMIAAQNPRGLLVFRDELSGWIGGFDRYSPRSGAEASLWLELWDGQGIANDRKTSGLIFAPRTAISICGGIQPGILARVMNSRMQDAGLSGRLLYAMPPKIPKRWTDAVIDTAIRTRMQLLFDSLWSLQPLIDGDGNPVPENLVFSEKARRLWIEFYDTHAQATAEQSGALAGAFSKLESYAARIALIFHLVRVAMGDPSIADPLVVDDVSLANAIRLVRWLARETVRVHALMGEDEPDRDRRQLIDFIRRNGGRITVRQVARNGPKGCRGPGKAFAALEALYQVGAGYWENRGGGNGDSSVNGASFVLFEDGTLPPGQGGDGGQSACDSETHATTPPPRSSSATLTSTSSYDEISNRGNRVVACRMGLSAETHIVSSKADSGVSRREEESVWER